MHNTAKEVWKPTPQEEVSMTFVSASAIRYKMKKIEGFEGWFYTGATNHFGHFPPNKGSRKGKQRFAPYQLRLVRGFSFLYLTIAKIAPDEDEFDFPTISYIVLLDFQLEVFYYAWKEGP